MKPQISGSFGPSVVVTSNNKRLINIAGGSNSGDVYREVGSSSQDPFARVQEVIENEIPEDQRTELKEIVAKVKEEIARPEASVGLIDLILNRLQSTAPRVLPSLARAIIECSTCPTIRAVASRAVSA